jgi:hypothetical protein
MLGCDPLKLGKEVGVEWWADRRLELLPKIGTHSGSGTKYDQAIRRSKRGHARSLARR